MNIAKRFPLILSYSRIIATPFIIGSIIDDRLWLAVLLFTAAAWTDWIDGFCARRFNAVSSHGAFIDPLADKILILGTLATFVALHSLSPYIFGIIVAREISVTLLRSWSGFKKKRFVTAWHGKYKTFFQIVLVYSLFAYHSSLMHASTVTTISILVGVYSLFSGLWYFYHYFKK